MTYVCIGCDEESDTSRVKHKTKTNDKGKEVSDCKKKKVTRKCGHS